MSVTNESTSSISSEAYDLLDCFSGEMADLVYEWAEEIARKRDSVGPDQCTLIEEQDVKDATRRVIVALKHLMVSDGVSKRAADSIEKMLECFEQSSRV